MNDTAILAFQTAAGVTPDYLSLTVRTLLFAMTLLWAAWCVLGLTHRLRHHTLDELDIPFFLFRILLCVVNTLLKQIQFPSSNEKPFGWDLTENIFFSAPQSFEEGWLFDDYPTKLSPFKV